MFLKVGCLSEKIGYYEALTNRYHMNRQQQDDYMTSSHGYIGERVMYDLLQEYKECICLWDIAVNLPYRGAVQYDFIVIHEYTVMHFDIKNYKGDYTLQHGNLVSSNDRIIKNPEPQLIRAHHYLEKLVFEFDRRFTLESYMVFINDQFNLNDRAPSDRWIFRSQLKNVLKSLTGYNNLKGSNISLAKHLIKLHQPLQQYDYFDRVPLVNIRTGYKCPLCKKLPAFNTHSTQFIVCSFCRRKIGMRYLIEYNLKELFILKGDGITPAEIKTFIPESKRSTISRVLTEHFTKTGVSKGVRYFLK
ncbi:nuclease-related domain-containing protein [Macrococcus lamae]|uniref:NERD domain-containing protein n=1 Tax=Macrococcus lamae TaxID=198484 RepID=A0A4V3BEX7_9STAP|nr:nuclease-related domain-containing protein [Macrococcus lamae]TDM11857.1 NERD domain-containing protein [Macrococcus lamae]